MKAFILVSTWMLMLIEANAQNDRERVTINIKNGTVLQVLKDVGSQTGLGCTNKDYLLEHAFPVSINLTNATVENVIDLCSRGQHFVLVREGTQIVTKERYIQFFGRIRNSLKEPVKGVRVSAEGHKQTVLSDVQGYFNLGEIFSNAKITLSSDEIRTLSFHVAGKTNREIEVEEIVTELQDINVVASTGQQYLFRKFSPSSVFVVRNANLQTQSGNTITERMKYITLGWSSPTSTAFGTNQTSQSITVRSTLFANPNALMVVDNFPYYGNINDINPNDIAEINILKDATVTSQWGTRSGNGVIAITTKSGKYNSPMELTINSNVTIRNTPNVYYYPIMDPRDKTAYLKGLFDAGFYRPLEYLPLQVAMPSIVENFIKHRDGIISDDQLSGRLRNLERDVRDDFKHYIYRKLSSEKHISAQLSGGTLANSYYLSVGYDYQMPMIKGSQRDRKSLVFNHNYNFKNRLELSNALWYSRSWEHNMDDIPDIREPMDSNGIFVSQPFYWRQNYLDSAGRGKLLNWNYIPGMEFNLRNKTLTNENIRLKSNLKWTLFDGLDFNLQYQYQTTSTEMRCVKDQDSYEVRNLVNSFTQIIGDSVIRRIPEGAILDMVNSSLVANSFRPHLVLTKAWSAKHDLKLQLATEYVRIQESVNPKKFYEYKDDMAAVADRLNYGTEFMQYYDNNVFEQIPVADPSYTTKNRYNSHFLIANYNFASRISASASARMDKVRMTPDIVNAKFIKSFSGGAGWTVSAEKFYRSSWLTYLKLRTSVGTNGNAPIPTLLTPNNQTAGTFYNNIDQKSKAPHWETTRTANFGLDFCTKNNLFQGSIDAYKKVGKDLIVFRADNAIRADGLITDNLASTTGTALDLFLSTQNLNGKLRWSTKLLFTYNNDKVTTFYDTTVASWLYCEPSYQNVVPGKALYGIFSYDYGGLDGTTGNPYGYFQGHKTDDYSAILTEPGFKHLRYHGRSTPKIYGSFLNEFSLGALNVSFIITYKFGYYFRRNSVNYYDLAFGFSNGSSDYNLRWKKSGDESKTTVPSAVMPTTRERDLFYAYSSVLVERGDHIRLQAINTNWNCKVKWLEKYHFKNCTFYLNVNNLGILWRANDKHIDPDEIKDIPAPASLFAGMKLTFK